MNIFRRKLSIQIAQKLKEVNLIGRDFINPHNLSPPEIKSILWTALDIQHLQRRRNLKLKQLETARITLLMDKPNIKTQIPLINASKLLNIQINPIVDNTWTTGDRNLEDYGRILSTFSDLIFCEITNQNIIEMIANGANIPVISVSSKDYCLIKNLTDILTIYKSFRKLTGLTLSYIGLPGNVINTYLHILPQIKMNLKYFLIEGAISDVNYLNNAQKLCQIHNTEIHESINKTDAIYRSNIISLTPHNNEQYTINKKDIEEAAIKWILIHDVPRGNYEMDKNVFNHDHSLAWKAIKNLEWIYAALIVQFLSGYNHVTDEPNFDGEIK